MKNALRNPAIFLPNGTLVSFSSGPFPTPTNTVQGATAGNVTATNINNYASPLYFDLLNDDGVTHKRVRYWLNGTDLRREIVTGTVSSTTGNDSTTAASATSATAGTLIAHNITGFTAQKLYSNSSPTNYNVVRVSITSSETVQPSGGASTVTASADVTLRNNLF
jgi:hypothetical protein